MTFSHLCLGSQLTHDLHLASTRMRVQLPGLVLPLQLVRLLSLLPPTALPAVLPTLRRLVRSQRRSLRAALRFRPSSADVAPPATLL